jgi:hypothetical protein
MKIRSAAKRAVKEGAQELKAIGKGVLSDFGTLGKDFFWEGVGLTEDILVGFTAPPEDATSKSVRRNRKRRQQRR